MLRKKTRTERGEEQNGDGRMRMRLMPGKCRPRSSVFATDAQKNCTFSISVRHVVAALSEEMYQTSRLLD